MGLLLRPSDALYHAWVECVVDTQIVERDMCSLVKGIVGGNSYLTRTQEAKKAKGRRCPQHDVVIRWTLDLPHAAYAQ